MTNMMAYGAFAPIRFVYRIHQAAEHSFWLYVQNIGPQGALSASPRIVFFGTSRAQVEHWLQQRTETQSSRLAEG